MSHNNQSRYPESQRTSNSRSTSGQASRQIPGPERMAVPVVSPNSTNASTSFASPLTGSRSSVGMTGSSFAIEGSEYLEPTLAESTYARGAASSGDVRGSNHGTEKPWGGFARFMGMQREPSVMKKESPPGAYHDPMAAEYEQRGTASGDSWATDTDRPRVEEDNTDMDAVGFEPTRPSKFQSSFANRKSYKSFGRSGNSNEKGGN